MKRTKCPKCDKEISNSNYRKHVNSCNGTPPKEKLKKCPYCNLDLSTIEKAANRGNHVRWCPYNPKINNYRKSSQKSIDAMNYKKKELKHMNQWEKAKDLGYEIELSEETRYKMGCGNRNKPLSKKHKEKVRKGRIKYLKENPEKHPWRYSNKNISYPCELLKEKLLKNNIEFIEEFQPCLDINRFFSIDIFLPKFNIGIEVNGNQHYYDVSKEILTEYYQQRHDIIEKQGIQLIEIKYDKIEDLDINQFK